MFVFVWHPYKTRCVGVCVYGTGTRETMVAGVCSIMFCACDIAARVAHTILVCHVLIYILYNIALRCVTVMLDSLN